MSGCVGERANGWTRTAFGLWVAALSLSCATVEEGLREGKLYDACALAEEGTFPFGEIDDAERGKVRDYVENRVEFVVEELDWSSPEFMGEPLSHDELVLYRLRVTLPKGVRATQFDDYGYMESYASEIQSALTPLEKPQPEVVPPGPLVIPDPPKNPVYRPPPRPRSKGLMDAFVSLLTLPVDMIRAGVEVAVAVVKIPFDIANGIISGGRVSVGGGGTAPRTPGLTPAHRSPIFTDALLNEDEWRTLVDAATARYDKKLAAVLEHERDRKARIEKIGALTLEPCDLRQNRSCDVIRIRFRGKPKDSAWVFATFDTVVFPSDDAGAHSFDEMCGVSSFSLTAAAPPPPVPLRTKEGMKRDRKLAANARKAPVDVAGPPLPTLPSFLWKTRPPSGLSRAFAEAGVQSVSALSRSDLVCRVDVKHANRWNEPKGPDPIVRLAWGRETISGETVVGPDDVKRFHFVVHNVSARPGDRFRISLGDRDGNDVEYMGIAVADFDGVMPINFVLPTYTASCRNLSPSATLRRAKSSITKAERRLTRLQAKVASTKVSVTGGGFPSKDRDRLDREIQSVAAWLGPRHEVVGELVDGRTKAQQTFEARVVALRVAAQKDAPVFGAPIRATQHVRIVDVSSLCEPPLTARTKIDFFMSRKYRNAFHLGCITAILVEGTDRYESIHGLDDLGLAMVNPDGTMVARPGVLVGDATSWFTVKSVKKGKRIVVLVAESTPDGTAVSRSSNAVFLHQASGKFFRPKPSSLASLDPVALGASPKEEAKNP